MVLVIRGNKNNSDPINRLKDTLVLDRNKTGDSRLEVCKIELPKKTKIGIKNAKYQISSFQVLSGRGYCEGQHISNANITFVPQNTETFFCNFVSCL